MAFNIVTSYERSSQYSERCRSLFPQNNSVDYGEDSDLGMSPLSNSSFDDSDDIPNSSNNIGDYDVIGIVKREISITPEVTPYKYNLLHKSTPHSKDINLSCTSVKDIVSEKHIQKTPHDTVATSSKLPKLSHKSVADSFSSTPSKRKLSPYNSPEIPNKSLKVDFKNSKVRTTLFPEIDLFLPTKKFYSNSDSSLPNKIEFNHPKMDQIAKSKIFVPSSVHSRKKYPKRSSGGKINAGVKHNIRKPKPKRNTSLPLAKSTMNETQGSALRYYLENLRELKQSNENKQKLIVNKENTAPEVVTELSSNIGPSMNHIDKISCTHSNVEATAKMEVNCMNIIENGTHLSETEPEESQSLNLNSLDTNQYCNNSYISTNHSASNFTFKNQIHSKKSFQSELVKKRSLSPINDEPDQKKKFFKFSRNHKGLVSLNESIKLVVDQGKVSLLGGMTSKNPRLQQCLPNFEPEDFTVEESIMSQVVMDNILSSLDDATDNDLNKKQNQSLSVLTELQSNQLAVPSTSTLNLSEASQTPGSIVAASENAANLILSPISQMCDVTSGLALNSPKRVKNLSNLMETVTRSTSKKEFLSSKGTMLVKKKPITLVQRKFRKLHKDQMLLDAGQKKFGVTQCSECNFIYHMGDPSDEVCHMNYHEAVPVLKFPGWKNERVVADFQKNGRIIQIKPSDPKLWLRKASNLMEVINRELGCHNIEFSLDNSQIFFYVKNRIIAGCLVAVPISTGYKMLTVKAHETDLCSERCFPVKCGIARIWVSKNFRKEGIATALMDTLKKNFYFGYVLSNNEIAISSPTEMGKAFAKKYFGTPNFMIYFP